VYRTQDAGEHWQDITGNLSVPLLISLEVVKTNGQTVLLVGGTGGVYRAILPGVFTPTWSGLGEGLPNLLVTDLHYNATNDVPAAAPLGRGPCPPRTAPPSSVTPLSAPAVLTIAGSPGGGDQAPPPRAPNTPLSLLAPATGDGMNFPRRV